jgi:hypothetical protein
MDKPSAMGGLAAANSAFDLPMVLPALDRGKKVAKSGTRTGRPDVARAQHAGMIKDSSDTRHRISQLRGSSTLRERKITRLSTHAIPRRVCHTRPDAAMPPPLTHFFLPQGSHPHSKTTRKPQTCCAPHRGVLRVTSGSPLLASSESLDTMSVRRRRFLASHRTHKNFCLLFFCWTERRAAAGCR